jgi:hypothetical protein
LGILKKRGPGTILDLPSRILQAFDEFDANGQQFLWNLPTLLPI